MKKTEPKHRKDPVHNEDTVTTQTDIMARGSTLDYIPTEPNQGGRASGAVRISEPIACMPCHGDHINHGEHCVFSLHVSTPLKGDWQERFDIKYGSFELCDRISAQDSERLKDFIQKELDTQKQDLIKRLEKEKIKEENESDRLNELITQGDESERYFFNVTVGRLQAIDKAIELIKE